MAFELSLMILSGLGMVALLVHKHIEISRGQPAARVDEVRQKADPMLRDLHHSTGKFFSYFTIHNLILILNYAFVHIVKFFMDMSHKAHKISSDIVEKASKKTEDLSKSGAASFYLKQIKETKDEVKSAANQAPDSTKEVLK